MTEEEYFRKHYPDSCYGDKPLSPYWDFFQDGVEFGERQSEKKIEELETRCTELFLQNNEFAEQLTKATELIEDMYDQIPSSHSDYYKDVMERARQFLKEIEK